MLFLRFTKLNTFFESPDIFLLVGKMNRLVSRQLQSAVKVIIAPRQFSVLAHNRTSSTPLIEHYRSAWPDVLKDKPSAAMPEFPKRTVPDDLLRFHFTAHFDAGGALFYPHLRTNPADFKVRMKVNGYLSFTMPLVSLKTHYNLKHRCF